MPLHLARWDQSVASWVRRTDGPESRQMWALIFVSGGLWASKIVAWKIKILANKQKKSVSKSVFNWIILWNFVSLVSTCTCTSLQGAVGCIMGCLRTSHKMTIITGISSALFYFSCFPNIFTFTHLIFSPCIEMKLYLQFVSTYSGLFVFLSKF